jgi:hypothetical protein
VQQTLPRHSATFFLTTLAALALTLGSPPAAAPLQAQQVIINAFVSPGFNRLDDWSDGMVLLREQARSLNREVAGSADPGFSVSFGAGVRWLATPRWAFGLELERLRDELEIRLPGPMMHYYYDFYTASATSSVGRLVVRHVPRPGIPVALELSGGAGRGALDWATAGASAQGTGWGPYLGAAGLFTQRAVGLHMSFTVGARWHPIAMDYSGLTVRPVPDYCVANPDDTECFPGLFPERADLEGFLDGRDLDYTALYLRVDLGSGF